MYKMRTHYLVIIYLIVGADGNIFNGFWNWLDWTAHTDKWKTYKCNDCLPFIAVDRSVAIPINFTAPALTTTAINSTMLSLISTAATSPITLQSKIEPSDTPDIKLFDTPEIEPNISEFSDVVSKDTKKLIEPPLEIEKFVVFIQNITGEAKLFFCTGVLIDVQVVLTLKDCVRHNTADNLRVRLPKPGDGEHDESKRVTTIKTKDSCEIAVLILEKKFPLYTLKVDYIPIATRTDKFRWDNCKVYQVDKARVVRSVKVLLMRSLRSCNDKPAERKYICAESEVNICYEERGAVLVCDSRLLGIREEDMACTADPRFHYITPQDYWILGLIPYTLDKDDKLLRMKKQGSYKTYRKSLKPNADDFYYDSLLLLSSGCGLFWNVVNVSISVMVFMYFYLN